MVQCFVPDCNHVFYRESCSFFRFPTNEKDKKRWITLIRRADREPSASSRVCCCHFRDGKKSGGPVLFERNKDKVFNFPEMKTKKKILQPVENTTQEPESCHVSNFPRNEPSEAQKLLTIDNTLLENQVEMLTKKIQEQEEELNYCRVKYTYFSLKPDVVCMETGLPTKEIFEVVVNYVRRFEGSIKYFAGWQVQKETIKLEDQLLITLMKLKQNYTNLHLASLFQCSRATVSNIIITFLHVLYELLFQDAMKNVPSRNKNSTSMPASFSMFSNCRMVIDCTDVKIQAPKLLSDQKLTYSTYRGMHSFKVLIGVAPNATITYVSKLFPGSVSDKVVVQQSGLLNVFEPGDLILADKGFLIQDIVPNGVAVNIPPFLNKGKFTESEIKCTKDIARSRIHVERANARIKEFKILDCIPCSLRSYADKVVKVCSALVNLQTPLIKEIKDSLESVSK